MTSDHPALPPRASRPWLAVAAMAWVLAAVTSAVGGPEPLESVPFDGDVVLRGDVMWGRFGPWAIGEIEQGLVLMDFGEDVVEAGRGDLLEVSGQVRGDPGVAAGRRYRSVLRAREVESVQPSSFVPHRAGKAVRQTVDRRLHPYDDGRALLAGFLIGDTSRIAESDIEAMRRSGLAHFVAVSGSNVALFLGLLAVAAGPLALGPKRRALLGLAALPVYVAATRFEPSVMRASLMAGLALGGRLIGVVFEAWQLLALAVTALVLIDPDLVSNVGFQLSVAATAGVLVGARWPVQGRIARAMVITLGAQLAVAPLLLAHFGVVPLLSPLVNLVAAPLVAAATVLGALAVSGLGLAMAPATWLADAVLTLARGASRWPQLAAGEVALALTAALLWVAFSRVRPFLTAGAVCSLTAVLILGGSSLAPAQVVVLDVGQGDAILIHGGDGRFALVDGGPDQSVLLDRLHHYGVRSLDLVVLTHVHADHATGLAAVFDAVSVGEVWADIEPHTSGAADDFLTTAEARGIDVSAPSPGTMVQLGALRLEVEGPRRRYASPNDQSIVIEVLGPARSMLLSGDIETHAQADLGDLRADVLKVPHQGAGTSDPDWLTSVGSESAVISVGPNQFGHPVDWVIEVLEESNDVLRTDLDGDVVVDLAVSGS